MSEEPKPKTCFVICPIGEEGSEDRKRSDAVLNHIIAPAVTECGYEFPVRADKIAEPGIIMSQVIRHIIDADLVIADLTGYNPNVFYELALRHMIKKPAILTITVGENIPFDVAQLRVIEFDHADLDSANECKEKIVEQIRSIEEDPTKIDSPISVALRQSNDVREKSEREFLSIRNTILHTTIINEFPVQLHALRIFFLQNPEYMEKPEVRAFFKKWLTGLLVEKGIPAAPAGWDLTKIAELFNDLQKLDL